MAPRWVLRHAEKFVLKLLGLDKLPSYFILLAADSWRKTTEETNPQCLRKWSTQESSQKPSGENAEWHLRWERCTENAQKEWGQKTPKALLTQWAFQTRLQSALFKVLRTFNKLIPSSLQWRNEWQHKHSSSSRTKWESSKRHDVCSSARHAQSLQPFRVPLSYRHSTNQAPPPLPTQTGLLPGLFISKCFSAITRDAPLPDSLEGTEAGRDEKENLQYLNSLCFALPWQLQVPLPPLPHIPGVPGLLFTLDSFIPTKWFYDPSTVMNHFTPFWGETQTV